MNTVVYWLELRYDSSVTNILVQRDFHKSRSLRLSNEEGLWGELILYMSTLHVDVPSSTIKDRHDPTTTSCYRLKFWYLVWYYAGALHELQQLHLRSSSEFLHKVTLECWCLLVRSWLKRGSYIYYPKSPLQASGILRYHELSLSIEMAIIWYPVLWYQALYLFKSPINQVSILNEDCLEEH